MKAKGKEYWEPEMIAAFLKQLYDSDDILEGPSREFIKKDEDFNGGPGPDDQEDEDPEIN